MNKEEQIKRLAQNLFKNGFTKSMDYAIQTAANMLGFPDSLVTNELMKQEDSKYGGESLLNGGRDFSKEDDKPMSSRAQEPYDPSKYTGSDFTKRLSRSMAEERAFSQIPMSLRPQSSQGPETGESRYADNTRVGQQQVQPEDTTQQSHVAQDTTPEASDEALFIDYSGGKEMGGSHVDPANDLSHNTGTETRGDVHMKDDSMTLSDPTANADDESSVEDSSFFAELRDEEQTSLISGYMSSEKENFFSDAPDENNIPSESVVSDENIFKDSEYEKGDRRGSYMYERTSNHEIRSRFPVEFDNDEDFFTPVFQSSGADAKQESFGDSQSARTETHQAASAQASQPAQQVSQSQSQSGSSKPAEADVDITTMFNFKNMNG